MARLFDRIMASGCQPFRVGDLWTARPDEYRAVIRQGASAFGKGGEDDLSEHEIEELARELPSGPPADERLVAPLIDGVPVVAADEVARYFWSLNVKLGGLADLVNVLVPPFPVLWIEAQGIENPLGAHAFGAIVESVPPEEAPDDVAALEPSWLTHVSLFMEWRNGAPIGPCLMAYYALGQDGTWLKDPDGTPCMRERLPHFPVEIPDFLSFLAKVKLALGYAPVVLLTLSFMHCRNVALREITPPEKLARRAWKRHGHALTRYHVLDIEPLRRALDTEGEAQTKGLGHALHICRGHFKSFDEEAPLFGKYVGTYWWPAHVRGKPGHGVVEKDYRVRLDQGLGREYVEADEHPEIRPYASEHTGLDPDLGGRGLRAHNVTQNLLASAVEQAGHVPRRPKPDEPQYDLAWETDGVTWVAEVKSITPQNEERQMRLALGQVLRYRQLLAEEGRAVRALIAVEREPSDTTWPRLCDDEGIALLWPPFALVE